MRTPLAPDTLTTYVDVALDNVRRVYPNAPSLRLDGPDDLRPPDEVHPAFYGAYDWHSAVHMHWSLVRLRRTMAEGYRADEIDDVLGRHLGGPALAAEAAHLRHHPTFERPYGWAWVLALVDEVGRWGAAPGVVDGEGLGALADTVADLLGDWLPRLAHPIRSGTHHNTAFAMILALRHARATGRAALEDRLVATARRFHLGDVDAPAAYEPSGEDFLSPILTAAHLLAEVLPPDGFAAWLDRYLPGLAHVVPPTLAAPPPVADATDPRIVHLRGLALSRAWSWRAIARALPPRDERRSAALDAADRHLAAGLEHVVTGDYGGDHWLLTFALLAVDGP